MSDSEFSTEETKCITRLTAIIANILAVKFGCNVVYKYIYNPYAHDEYADDCDYGSEYGLEKEHEFKQLFDSSDTITIVHSEYHNRISIKHSRHGVLMLCQFTFMFRGFRSFEFYRDIYEEHNAIIDMSMLEQLFEKQGIACADMFNNFISAHDYHVDWYKNNFQIISVPESEYELVNYPSSMRYTPFTVFEINGNCVEFDLIKALETIQ